MRMARQVLEGRLEGHFMNAESRKKCIGVECPFISW